MKSSQSESQGADRMTFHTFGRFMVKIDCVAPKGEYARDWKKTLLHRVKSSDTAW